MAVRKSPPVLLPGAQRVERVTRADKLPTLEREAGSWRRVLAGCAVAALVIAGALAGGITLDYQDRYGADNENSIGLVIAATLVTVGAGFGLLTWRDGRRATSALIDGHRQAWDSSPRAGRPAPHRFGRYALGIVAGLVGLASLVVALVGRGRDEPFVFGEASLGARFVTMGALGVAVVLLLATAALAGGQLRVRRRLAELGRAATPPPPATADAVAVLEPTPASDSELTVADEPATLTESQESTGPTEPSPAVMRWEMTSDPGEFWQHAHDWLAKSPVLNSVILASVDGRRSGAIAQDELAMYATFRGEDGEIAGVAMHTPPHAAYLGAMPLPAVPLLVDVLIEADAELPGVTGTDDHADRFAEIWSDRTGDEAAVEMRHRIHQLARVTHPEDPPTGEVRPATDDDRELLIAWYEAFVAEAEPPGRGGGDVVAQVDLRLAEGRAHVWDDNGPVSLVGTSANHAGVVRIAPVYTPPDKRGRGYASVLVAAVSQQALDAGADRCSLYTDLANPTSNKIYAAVGYRPVADVTAYTFRTHHDA